MKLPIISLAASFFSLTSSNNLRYTKKECVSNYQGKLFSYSPDILKKIDIINSISIHYEFHGDQGIIFDDENHLKIIKKSLLNVSHGEILIPMLSHSDFELIIVASTQEEENNYKKICIPIEMIEESTNLELTNFLHVKLKTIYEKTHTVCRQINSKI